MKNTILVLAMAALAVLTIGCSSSLSRREASHQIDVMRKPHPMGPKKVMATYGVPGFELPEDDVLSEQIIHLDAHVAYGRLDFENKGQSPDSEEYFVDALSKIGYVSVQEEGPKTVPVTGTPLHYSHSRTVRLTPKVGAETRTRNDKTYASGFSCYPAPDFAQCNTPPVIEIDNGYTITGIVQDEIHAKVNILISWKLSKFGSELKPYAAAVQANEAKLERSDYDKYPALYPWEQFLNDHGISGRSPATILFQKFDDGWRIVNEHGESEKDL